MKKPKVKKKTGYKITRSTTAEQMLGLLREFFDGYDTWERKKLWDILTALRGPDNDAHIKDCTTCVIRSHALWTTGSTLPRYCADFGWDSSEAVARRKKTDSAGHFIRHAMKAFDALGLDWGKVNKKKELQ